MAKRFGDNVSISDALKEFVEKNKLQQGIDKVNVAATWHSMMGPAITKYTTQIKLEKTTLYVQLSSSVLREELSYGKHKIIAMLNQELGKEIIKELVLR